MERITKELPNGTWKIDGVNWTDIPGHIYGALCKLRDYENTGLNPADINLLKDKSNKLSLLNTGIFPKVKNDIVHCPNCNGVLGLVKTIKEDFFCEDCGQHIFFNKGRWLAENADKSE